MNEFIRATKAVCVIEPASHRIFPENLDIQGAPLGNRLVHQFPTQASPVIARIEEQSSDVIFNNGDKADDGATDLRHPCFSKRQINIPHGIGFRIEKLCC